MSSDTEDPNKSDEVEATEQETASAGSESGQEIVRSEDEALGEAALEAEEQEIAAAHVGVEKYVHAAFFAAGILAAFLSGKVILTLWNYCAEWPAAVRALPFLIEYTEEERGSLTLVIGAVVGVLAILRYYRRPAVRSWATSVASELARVTWPSKDTVTSGTIVVLVAGAIATFYIAVLDRLWAYLTNLVYGA